MAANSHVSYDLVDEILLRLPIKPLIRFKSVSRQWKSTIESQCFVERHMKKSGHRKILLALGSHDGESPGLIPGEEEEICYIGNCDASRMSLTCDGLICIPRSDSVEVCNPATREIRRFPPGGPLVSTELRTGTGRIPIRSLMHRKVLEKFVARFPTTRSSFGFGKNEVTGAYKVVELRGNGLSFTVDDCNVLDLKTGLWRHVGLVPYRIFCSERSIYVNNSLHWFTVDLMEPNASRIVAFDLHTEEFRVVSLSHPNFSFHSFHLYELLSLGDRLSVSEMKTTPSPHLDIWSMVDVQEERWEKMRSICLCRLHRTRQSKLQLFRPVAITHKDDGVVVTIWDYGATLFKSYPYQLLIHTVSQDAPLVASSYIQTLVPVR